VRIERGRLPVRPGAHTRLVAEIEAKLAAAADLSHRTGKPARRFKKFHWSTRDSRSRERRVVAKAEWTSGEANPRFIVTSPSGRGRGERVYCAPGEMENRIKECQLDLFADRTSAKTMRANQLRLWFASMAYVLLRGPAPYRAAPYAVAETTCGTSRLKLLKIGALVRVSVRRIKIAMTSAAPIRPSSPSPICGSLPPRRPPNSYPRYSRSMP